MGNTTHIRVSWDLYHTIRQIARSEGKQQLEVLEDLVMAGLKAKKMGETVECIYCGKKSAYTRICDECFYNPKVIRPTKFAAIYLHYALLVAPRQGLTGEFTEFIEKLNENIAKSYYKVTDEEWQVWQEWLDWRRRFRLGEASIDNPEWRNWCNRVWRQGHVGGRAVWTVLMELANTIGAEAIDLGEERVEERTSNRVTATDAVSASDRR